MSAVSESKLEKAARDALKMWDKTKPELDSAVVMAGLHGMFGGFKKVKPDDPPPPPSLTDKMEALRDALEEPKEPFFGAHVPEPPETEKPRYEECAKCGQRVRR